MQGPCKVRRPRFGATISALHLGDAVWAPASSGLDHLGTGADTDCFGAKLLFFSMILRRAVLFHNLIMHRIKYVEKRPTYCKPNYKDRLCKLLALIANQVRLVQIHYTSSD
uniref:Uncharacterized protein n=1 Tax=Romanomermis culicivorax TaxID=13658 RepID=A0A915K5C6_ROMCU